MFGAQRARGGLDSLGYKASDLTFPELLKAVPEPSTWAMTLAGFAGLGWLASRRKTSPA
jgi:PEP-CTERM motif